MLNVFRGSLHRLFPFLSWFPIAKDTLRADVIAGISVGLVLVPQSMAYAQLAGMPAHYGLYAALLPGLIGALWGSSKQLATGPVAVVSLLTASSLAPLAVMGSDQFVALAIFLALLAGLIQFGLGLFKLGVIVNFLSYPVVAGFTNAAAIIIGLSQLNKLFGVSKPSSDYFINDIYAVLLKVGDLHLLTFVFGIGALATLYLLKKYQPKIPAILVVAVVTTFLSWLLDYELKGGRVVGVIPAGLPDFAFPQINASAAVSLFGSALVISLVGFMEAISIAKAMAVKTKDKIDPNKELIGQGLANIVGSFAQSYPVSGSFSRSALNLAAGAKTGLSAVFTGLLVLLTLLFLPPLLYHLAEAALAAIIMMAVVGLINFSVFFQTWKIQKHDCIAAVTTFIATLAFAPHLDKGIMVGSGLALGLYLYRTMKPRVAILGRHIDGTLRDVKFYNLRQDSRIVAIRFDGSLYFANVAYFEDMLLEAVANFPEARYVLVVGDGINELDSSGEEVLHRLVERLMANKVTMVFSGLKRQVIEVMHKTPLFTMIGAQNMFSDEDKALESIYRWLEVEKIIPEFCPLLRDSNAEDETFAKSS